MSRTIPDPVFAAAARAELERRVRATRPDADDLTVTMPFRPLRSWRMELVAIGGVLALVAGVTAGVTALRPVLDAGGPPVVSTARPTDRGPTLLPSSTPTPAPTTEQPPATTTPPVTSRPLIGPAGARQRPEAEVRAWARSIGNNDIWAEQAVLDIRCMAQHGFLYDPEFEYRSGLAAMRAGMTDAQYAAYTAAMYGLPTDAPYDWRTAGCHGLSVHVTGQDTAN